jgi:uncharacterized membrane protein
MVASLWLVGVAFAAFTAPLAWRRTGVTSALPFIAVAVGGVHGSKAGELRDLGIDPELGVTLNLLYSTVAALVFAWVAARWRKMRRR